MTLAIQTVLLRPYVFFFLAVSCYSASRLLGWSRTAALFGITWLTAFLSELASTRIGIPFGHYFYTESTKGQELYLANVPFMDSLSFTFLLYASYTMALAFVLPMARDSGQPSWVMLPALWTHWTVIGLASVFFMLIDVVIDPVALRGDRWFLGQIYGYADDGVYFGVPLSNFVGWAIVGGLSLTGFRVLDRYVHRTGSVRRERVRGALLSGIGLYYLVLAFNLAVTFWIGELLIGTVGCFIYLPLTALVLLRIAGRLPALQEQAL